MAAILRCSCYDCHSNETRLRWFDQIVPEEWLVARGVERGRARLNFSETGHLPPGAQRAALFEAIAPRALAAASQRAPAS